MIGVAWIVWQSEELFNEMKKVIPCDSHHVPPGKSTDEQKLSWLNWLTQKNERGTSYNIHAIWIWYFDAYMKPRLSSTA